MTTLLDDIADLRSRVGNVVARATREREVHDADDELLVETLARAADLHRAVEAVLVECAGETAERSRSTVRDERLTTRMGSRSVNELLQRLTRASPQTAGRLSRRRRAPLLRGIPSRERSARRRYLRCVGRCSTATPASTG